MEPTESSQLPFKKIITASVLSAIIPAIIIGVVAFAYQRNQNNKVEADLQYKIEAPNAKIAVANLPATVLATTVPSPVPASTSTPTSTATTLSVQRLLTTATYDWVDKKELPTSVSVILPAELSDSVAAYSAANMVFLAPKGWTGAGSVGTNGGFSISVTPVGDPAHSMEMHIMGDPACIGCVFSDAAAYFPNGKQWSEDNGFPIPKNLHALATDTLVTPQLAHYTELFTADGGKNEGYAHVGMKDGRPTAPFIRVEFGPFGLIENHSLYSFLLDDFVARQKLK